MGNVTVPRTMRNARRDAVAAASPASMPAAIPSHPKSAATIALIGACRLPAAAIDTSPCSHLRPPLPSLRC